MWPTLTASMPTLVSAAASPQLRRKLHLDMLLSIGARAAGDVFAGLSQRGLARLSAAGLNGTDDESAGDLKRALAST